MILAFAVLLTCLMLMVLITDATTYRIPNWLVLLFILLYPALLIINPVPDWPTALLIGVATFVIGFALWFLRVFGGGDIKLLSVIAIYAGEKSIVELMMLVAILGGAFSIILLGLRPLTSLLLSHLPSPPKIPRVLMEGEPIPYGVTIAIAFLVLLWTSKLPGLVLS